jgi:hypothetical protein
VQARPEIGGNTLRVYLYIAKNGPCELRDVQHGVGLSSPSLASYHLNKLVASGYMKQDNLGKYLATNESTAQILEGYLKIGTTIVPQLLFFTVFFTILAAYFSYDSLYLGGPTIYIVSILIATMATLWFESLRLMRRV